MGIYIIWYDGIINIQLLYVTKLTHYSKKIKVFLYNADIYIVF